VQPVRVDRQAEEPVAMTEDRARQAPPREVIGRQREVRRANAELQREVERRRRLAAARDADQDHLRLGELARRCAVVVRLREVDRLHPREILVAVGDAVRAPAVCELRARNSASSGAMKIWNRSSVSACASRRSVSLAASSTIELNTIGCSTSVAAVALTCSTTAAIFSGESTNGIVRRTNWKSSNCDSKLFAEHLGGDAGAIGDEEDAPALCTAIRPARAGLPLGPDRRDARGQIGQVAEVEAAFAGAVVVRAARGEQAEGARVAGELRELLARVRWRQHFDAVAAGIAKIAD
jgi:hypothetical protein